jgi:hypothetical protein
MEMNSTLTAVPNNVRTTELTAALSRFGWASICRMFSSVKTLGQIWIPPLTVSIESLKAIAATLRNGYSMMMNTNTING